MVQAVRNPWQRFGVVILATALATLLRWALRPVMGDTAPFLLFIPAIVVAAWFGGMLDGLVTTLLGLLFARYVIVLHPRTAAIPPNPLVLYPLYGLIGLLLSVLVEAMNRARLRAERSQEELRAAKEAVESASRAKDAFLAALSHELRTPLTPVLMSVSVLESDKRIPKELRQEIGMIRRNVQMEARLIDDLLDLSRIIQGKMPLQFETMDAHAKVENAIEICRGDIDAKRLRLDLGLRASRYCVRADAGRFQQVIWNLLKNAVKFTPEGGTIAITTEDGPGDRLRIRVADSGIGIAPEVLPRLFDAFEQGGVETTRRFGGLGLGLAISKAIVDAHGGTLTATSPGRDKGATFSVELPNAEFPEDSSCELPKVGTNGQRRALRILLAEDHADTARVMGRLLTRLGHRVAVAKSVAAAVDLATAGEFDLLVSDLGLPDGSGLDLMRRLRPMKGIALTGYGMEDDVEKTREAGFLVI